MGSFPNILQLIFVSIMRALTDHEKRTIRIASVAITIYLLAFYCFRGWRQLEARHSEYQRLVQDAKELRLELRRYENKVLRLEKLRKAFPMELSMLSKATLVGEVSAAIQKAAQSGGVELGPIRESPARASAKELASMQFEGTGKVGSIMALLHALEDLEYPVILDSVQIGSDPRKPGGLKLSLTISILNFEQWKAVGVANA